MFKKKKVKNFLYKRNNINFMESDAFLTKEKKYIK